MSFHLIISIILVCCMVYKLINTKLKKLYFPGSRKRPYRRKIKCSACQKEIYNDNFEKHNNSAHRGNARIIHLLDPSQKKLIFSLSETTVNKFICVLFFII